MLLTRLAATLTLLALAAAAAPPAMAGGPSRPGSPAAPQQGGPGTGQQEEAPRREERIVVTAQRVPGALESVGSSVTVLTRDEIEASGARWLSDVLGTVPGITVVRAGGAGTQASAFLRGTNSNHTLFLINGVEVNSPSTGAYDLTHLPAAHIERVEVVRGPQSSLYGSQALGGVINVITRRGGGPPGGGIEVDGGSFGTGRVQAWAEGGVKDLGWSAGVDYSDTDGISAAARERGNLEEDGYRNVTWDGRVDWRGGGGMSLDGFVRGFDARTEIDDFAFGVGPVDDDNLVSDTREIYGALTVRYDADGWSSQVRVSDSELSLETENPDGSFSRRFSLDGSIREVDWQAELELPGDQALVAGVEYQRESATVESRTVFGTSGFEERVDVAGIYAEDRLRLGSRAVVTVGGRHEEHGTFGGHTTFRGTGTVTLGPWRLHGSAGSGFRAPSLNDLFFPGFGNPELSPEESVGVDLGVTGRWPAAGLRVDATGFWNDVDDLVDFSPAGPVNLGRVTTRGVELSGDWTSGEAVDVAAAYTFTEAFDEATDLQLVRRPRHQGSVSLTVRPTGSLRLFTDLRTSGRRPDSGPLGRVSLDGHAVWNAAATWTVTPSLGVRVRVENILDESYQEAFGFGTPGASAYAGLVLRLGARR